MTTETKICERLQDAIKEAEFKAWDSLARYKFQMFGYWAAIWVHLNRVSGENRPNPFRSLVNLAKDRRKLTLIDKSAGAQNERR